MHFQKSVNDFWALQCEQRFNMGVSLMKAEFEVTILPDGAISIKTADLSGEHHASADEFIKLVHQLAGGARETKSTRDHHHHHKHQHHEHRH